MKKLIQLSIFILLIIGINSCKKDKGINPDLGYNYFPDDCGKYVVYLVDSIYYDDFNKKIDTFQFQLKHRIESFYLDNQGRVTQRIERSIKFYNPLVPYDSMQWTLRDVWSANLTATTAELVEENVRFIKLAFPIKETQNWNGNAQNTLANWKYDYNFIDLPRTHKGIVYDSVLEVKQYDDKNKILTQRQYYIEQYARNVGMIYKRVIDIQSQPPDGSTPTQIQIFFNTPIMQRVTSGYQYTYTILSYGIEL